MRRVKRSWSIVGVVVAAFTIISAGIGLIQARFAALATLYSNLKNISDPAELLIANTRLGQQSSLFYPLGIFLVTLGLAMMFSISLRVGLPFLIAIIQEHKQEVKRSRIKALGWSNLVLILVALVLAGGALWFSLQVRLAFFNLFTVLLDHQSFVVGFMVLAMIFWVFLDVALKDPK